MIMNGFGGEAGGPSAGFQEGKEQWRKKKQEEE